MNQHSIFVLKSCRVYLLKISFDFVQVQVTGNLAAENVPQRTEPRSFVEPREKDLRDRYQGVANNARDDNQRRGTDRRQSMEAISSDRGFQATTAYSRVTDTRPSGLSGAQDNLRHEMPGRTEPNISDPHTLVPVAVQETFGRDSKHHGSRERSSERKETGFSQKEYPIEQSRVGNFREEDPVFVGDQSQYDRGQSRSSVPKAPNLSVFPGNSNSFAKTSQVPPSKNSRYPQTFEGDRERVENRMVTDAPLVGVGMVLEPEDPGRDGLCYVSEVRKGGSLDCTGLVRTMDRLVAVDGFRCIGVLRSQIRDRVMGR